MKQEHGIGGGEEGQIERLALAALRTLPDTSVLVFDTDLRFVLAGGEALANHSVSPSHLEGRLCADAIAAERWARYEPMYRAALAGESSSMEVAAINLKRRYLVSVGPLRDASGAITGGIVIARDVTARHAAEEHLEHSRRLLQDVLDSVTAGVAVKDRERRYILVNTAYERFQAFSRDQLRGRTVRELYAPELADVSDSADRRALETGESSIEERKVPLPDGSEGAFLIGRSALRDPAGEVYGLCAVITDIRERIGIERALHEARELFEQALEHAPIGMALIGLDGHLTRVNAALSKLTGYGREELLTKAFTDLTHPDDLARAIETFEGLVTGEVTAYEAEERYVDAAGHTSWARVSGSLVRDANGQPHYVVVQLQDISDQKLMEARLRHLADHDSLTELPNRRYFDEQLAIQIGRCQRYGENAALILVDLDGFKAVNDRYGHKVGDEVLRAVAAAIRNRLRASDIAARIGGDEFAVLLPMAARDVTAVANAIREAIGDATVKTREEVIRLTASVGVAVLDSRTADPDQPLAAADAAMYRDKSRGHRRSPGTTGQ